MVVESATGVVLENAISSEAAFEPTCDSIAVERE